MSHLERRADISAHRARCVAVSGTARAHVLSVKMISRDRSLKIADNFCKERTMYTRPNENLMLRDHKLCHLAVKAFERRERIEYVLNLVLTVLLLFGSTLILVDLIFFV
jgi:hypothetical protein